MKQFVLITLFALVAAGCASVDRPAKGPETINLENLLKSDLALADNVEIIVSMVTIPANKALPKHWHPGEEFVYIMEGEATLWQEGKDDILMTKGQIYKIPYKQVHTAMTSKKGGKALVFRVHEKGKPERVKAE